MSATMTPFRPRSAMMLAGGLGRRMLPLTETMPKPLVEVQGRALIDHGLDRLAEFGVERAVVNVHYFADKLEAHVGGRTRPKIVISDERDRLMDTGGGVKKALAALGSDPFFIMNSDSFWIEGAVPNLEAMARQWNPETMDILLMVAASTASIGLPGAGDFIMLPDGRLRRRPERQIAPFNYTGTGIVAPHLFDNTPSEPFSMNLLFDRAIESDRLYGVRLGGTWLHVGTPKDVGLAESCIRESAA